ncbi:MAG TPA: alpha/beta fold hydrolase [Polyangia bacterium]
MDVVIKGRRLSVDVGPQPAGRSVPCVLLHPFPFDRRYYGNLSGVLESRARTIVPDYRGGGGSPLDGPFSIADLADDLAGILDHLQIDRAVVAGLSMGGYVALAFAAKYSRRLLGLVLADTRAGADSPETRAAREKSIELIRTKGVDAFIEAQIPRLVAPNAPAKVKDEVRALATKNPDSLVALLTALRDRPDRTGELPSITCPTLVVVGTEDVITPPADAAAMATAISKAVLVELPDAGHLSSLEAPTPFAQAITGFLGRANG